MFHGIERPFVSSPSHHGDELWEVPEGAENPTGWNEARECRRSPSDLGPDRPWANLGQRGGVAGGRHSKTTPDFANAVDNGRHSRMNEDLHLCLHGPQARMM